MIPPPPRSTLFPYTTLFRYHVMFEGEISYDFDQGFTEHCLSTGCTVTVASSNLKVLHGLVGPKFIGGRQDRKSTRLNSSHTVISYAVFCMKKKKQHTRTHPP